MTQWRYSNKERAFVEYYLATWNGTKSMRLAGYKGNDNNLAAMASEYLRKPKIQELIEKRMSELTIKANEVIMRLGQHATATISDFIDDNGVIDWLAVKEKGYLIKKIVHKKGQHAQIELHDPQSALVHMGRHYQLFTDKVKVEDWRTEIIGLIRTGEVAAEDVIKELGKDLARELFESAGIPISTN